MKDKRSRSVTRAPEVASFRRQRKEDKEKGLAKKVADKKILDPDVDLPAKRKLRKEIGRLMNLLIADDFPEVVDVEVLRKMPTGLGGFATVGATNPRRNESMRPLGAFGLLKYRATSLEHAWIVPGIGFKAKHTGLRDINFLPDVGMENGLILPRTGRKGKLQPAVTRVMLPSSGREKSVNDRQIELGRRLSSPDEIATVVGTSEYERRVQDDEALPCTEIWAFDEDIVSLRALNEERLELVRNALQNVRDRN